MNNKKWKRTKTTNPGYQTKKMISPKLLELKGRRMVKALK